jgi:hypothetical protein
VSSIIVQLSKVIRAGVAILSGSTLLLVCTHFNGPESGGQVAEPAEQQAACIAWPPADFMVDVLRTTGDDLDKDAVARAVALISRCQFAESDTVRKLTKTMESPHRGSMSD